MMAASSVQQISQLTFKDPVAVTRMIMRLFEYWDLTNDEQTMLLSLSPNTRSTLSRYRKGQSTLSCNRDTYDRVRYLLSIHKHLRKIFPYNEELAYQWPKTSNRFYDGKTPIEVIAEKGFLGLAEVHDYLENYRRRGS